MVNSVDILSQPATHGNSDNLCTSAFLLFAAGVNFPLTSKFILLAIVTGAVYTD